MTINVQYANQNMVSSSSPLATLAALDILQMGGNAFDAGLCASAVLTVVLPMSSGLGGDLAIAAYVNKEQKTYSITSLGKAPSLATIENFSKKNLVSIPRIGILSATVPAMIEAYLSIHEKFCTLPLKRILAPAIRYAQQGITVGAQLNRWIKNNQDVIKNDEYLSKIFLPYGKAAEPGSIIKQIEVAKTFEDIALFSHSYLEKSRFVENCMSINKRHEGFFEEKDFYENQCIIENPLSCKINDLTISTTTIPTQGYLLLQNLKLMEMVNNKNTINSFSNKIHVLSEIFNQTYWQRLCRVGDPKFVDNLDDILLENNIRYLYDQINFDTVSPCKYKGYYNSGDTTYFNIIDCYGNAVSWIQSLSLGFGSGVSIPGTGIIFNSRLGRSCSLNPSHPNSCMPGKRPVNTIFPYLIMKNNSVYMVGGTPGGDGQAQWNTSFLSSIIFENAEPIQMLREPRWTYFPGADLIESDIIQSIHVDKEISKDIVEDLKLKGHEVISKNKISCAIRMIQNKNSFLIGADDNREEGLTLGS